MLKAGEFHKKGGEFWGEFNGVFTTENPEGLHRGTQRFSKITEGGFAGR
jgi:hypothetical protein